MKVKRFTPVFLIILLLASCTSNIEMPSSIFNNNTMYNLYMDSADAARNNLNYNESIACYKKAYYWNDSTYMPLFNIANILTSKYEFSSVVKICNFIENNYNEDDSFFLVYALKSQAYSMLGKKLDALKYSDRSINSIFKRRLDGEMENDFLSSFFSDRAKILFELKSDSLCRLDIEKALELDALNADAIYYKGLLELKADRKLAACKYLKYAANLGNKEAETFFSKACQ